VDFRDRVNNLLKSATKAFGELVEYYPSIGGTYEIRAIFDNEYEAMDSESEQLISSNLPVLGVNLNDLDFEIKVGDTVLVRNLIFKIYDVREDGQGGARLYIHRANHDQKVVKKKGSTSP